MTMHSTKTKLLEYDDGLRQSVLPVIIRQLVTMRAALASQAACEREIRESEGERRRSRSNMTTQLREDPSTYIT